LYIFTFFYKIALWCRNGDVDFVFTCGIIIIIIIIIYLLTYLTYLLTHILFTYLITYLISYFLLTAIELSLGDINPYTSTDKTNKNKYTQRKQYKTQYRQYKTRYIQVCILPKHPHIHTPTHYKSHTHTHTPIHYKTS
jgi:hypothetical protein